MGRCSLLVHTTAALLAVSGCASSGGLTPAPDQEEFSPNQLEGLYLWLDASDDSTLFLNEEGTRPAAVGDAVAVWRDKSGQGIDAVQTVEDSRPHRYSGPQSGSPSLLFAPSGDRWGDAMMLPGFEGAFGLPEWTVLLAVKVDRSAKNGTAET